MRGKLKNPPENCIPTGITPAGAGKTAFYGSYNPQHEDHPRRCGENRRVVGVAFGRERITPAGAGKTIQYMLDREINLDHPRRCGENPNSGRQEHISSGSPPQVRGKHNAYYIRNNPLRITPAGAGKTKMQYHNYIGHWDHPRRCGENHSRREQKRRRHGSPPQVRGKLGFPSPLFDSHRITPAGAGKTRRCCRLSYCQKDHPRRCGENSSTTSKTSLRSGITPAGAGKTYLEGCFR